MFECEDRLRNRRKPRAKLESTLSEYDGSMSKFTDLESLAAHAEPTKGVLPDGHASQAASRSNSGSAMCWAREQDASDIGTPAEAAGKVGRGFLVVPEVCSRAGWRAVPGA